MLMQREMARHLPQSHVLRISQMGGDSRIQVRKTRASCCVLPRCMDSLPCSRIVQWRRFVGTAMQGLAEKCELLSARLASLENIAEAVNTGACSLGYAESLLRTRYFSLLANRRSVALACRPSSLSMSVAVLVCCTVHAGYSILSVARRGVQASLCLRSGRGFAVVGGDEQWVDGPQGQWLRCAAIADCRAAVR